VRHLLHEEIDELFLPLFRVSSDAFRLAHLFEIRLAHLFEIRLWDVHQSRALLLGCAARGRGSTASCVGHDDVLNAFGRVAAFASAYE
jgi:hypothetical protein